MIEMRWLTRRIDYTGISQGHAPDTERVLQFRFQDHNPLGFLPSPWTAWKDVPEHADDIGGKS